MLSLEEISTQTTPFDTNGPTPVRRKPESNPNTYAQWTGTQTDMLTAHRHCCLLVRVAALAETGKAKSRTV